MVTIMPVYKDEADKYHKIHPQEIYAMRMMILQEEFGFSYLNARAYLCGLRTENIRSIFYDVTPENDNESNGKLYELILEQRNLLVEDLWFKTNKAYGRFGECDRLINREPDEKVWF